MDNKHCTVTLRPLTKIDGADLDKVSDEASFHFTRDLSDDQTPEGFPFLWDSPQRKIERISFAILLEDRLVGEVALSGVDLDERVASVTMGIAEKNNRCQGIGKAALNQILSYAFYSLGLEKVTADTISTNLPAVRSLEQGGFKLTGIERYAVQIANLRMDRLHFTITVDQFNGHGNSES